MTITNHRLYTQLSNDYISFYENDSKYADVTIQVGKDENFKEFNVHSFVLLVRSNYFRKKIEEIKEKSDDGKFVIEMSDINSKLFDQILRYFYGGKFKYNPSEVFDYLLISKELDITELLELLQDELLKSPNQIYQKFSTTLQISSSFEKLHEFCLKTIRNYPEMVFRSQDFHLLDEDTLLVLLRNKNLSFKEIEKWESIVKWGNYRTTDTSSSTNENFSEMPDFSLWAKVKFRDLANTLVQFIPLIDFYKITPEDFYRKVKPFKKVVGNQLYDEILRYHLISKNKQSNQAQPSTSTSSSASPQQNDEPKPEAPEPSINYEGLIKIDSGLITIDYFQLIARWINNEPSNHYVFTLLLRGSQDGFTASKFHELCDNKGATLTIIRVGGSGEIIGGYNPVSWKKSARKKHSDVAGSFVFKLDKKNIDRSIIGRPRSANCTTIGNSPDDGPIFVGALYIKGKSGMCRGTTYNPSIIKEKKKEFSVEEYEVYQVN